MNPEISLPADAATTIRDNFIAGIQNNLGTGLAILANMINELKRKTISPLFTSEHQFGKINECMLLLAEAHKQSTLLRRQNVKHLLNDSLHILCSKRAMEKRFSKSPRGAKVQASAFDQKNPGSNRRQHYVYLCV